MRDHLTLAWIVAVWFIVGAVCSLGSQRSRKAERRARAQAEAMAGKAEPMG